MDFIIAHQLDIMLFMCGVCGILAFMTLITKNLPRNTKIILAAMEASAMFLLLFDRFAYIYRGNVTTLGYYMVRISNGMVYFLSLIIPFLVTKFIEDAIVNEAKVKVPRLLRVTELLFVLGIILVIVSQFTGLYYTFDENNNYSRAPLNILCYVIPVAIVILQELTIIKNIKKIDFKLAISMIICISLPTLSSVIQIFAYGISITNIVTAAIVCVFYTYALRFLSEAAKRATKHEIEFYKEAQKKEAMLFGQTTEALANAIDAKDSYTSGHSSRVANYSKLIALEAGLSEEECEQVYFAGMLHDIGKIGIRNYIINKPGKLTEEEFAVIKSHTVIGNQILLSIKQNPFLALGAHYHHERYDGTGYPEGISGDNIPRVARIIAVADAYDAMTSERSYRKPLERNEVRRELIDCSGTQFDPIFAKAMLDLIDREIV